VQLPLHVPHTGDNVIDKDEYSKAYVEFGLTPEQCDQAYNTFTEVGKSTLDKYSCLFIVSHPVVASPLL